MVAVTIAPTQTHTYYTSSNTSSVLTTTTSYPSTPSPSYTPSSHSEFSSSTCTDSDFGIPIQVPQPQPQCPSSSPIKKFRLRIRMPSKNTQVSSTPEGIVEGMPNKTPHPRFPVRMRTLKELKNSSMKFLPRKRRVMVAGPIECSDIEVQKDVGAVDTVAGCGGAPRQEKSYAEMECEIMGQHWLFPVAGAMSPVRQVEDVMRDQQRREVGRETGFGWEWYGGVRGY